MNAPSQSSPHYLWFERAGMRFAASMNHLQEVLSAPALRPVPATEPALTGLMILREHVLPVFDPASLASSEPSPQVASPIVIVLGLHGRPALGLLAEKVGKVMELPEPVPLTTPARLARTFAGESSRPGAPRLLVLDADGLAAAMGLGAADATNPFSPGLPSHRN
jgi:purine-binding chemotaxis protein CheW